VLQRRRPYLKNNDLWKTLYGTLDESWDPTRDIKVNLRSNDPNLNRNATDYRYNHKYIDAMEIMLHFINIKY